MLKEFLKALSGIQTRVITPIDSPALARLRTLSQASFLNMLNTQSALSQHVFNAVKEMDVETFIQHSEMQIDDVKAAFMETERSKALRQDYDRLVTEQRVVMRNYLIQKGFAHRDDITFDLRAGVLTEEVEA
jgi:Fe-S cluster biosynthesis and repair protein YggX